MWRTELRQVDFFRDPETGGPLYVRARIRPRWYWRLCRVWLFLGIVGRAYETLPDGKTYRLPVGTAWAVSGVADGPTR